ncbi:MAG: hypothetical protein KatS3mg115_0504 [Candidatus Poribacteria bacterium]|nr:MAG: hypothetical protein KatS3mg115_0504 [Candidatus Poribacteria bacterium]
MAAAVGGLAAPMRSGWREQLIARYGESRGAAVRFAEAFEACEYGAPLTPQQVERLFPF